MTIARSVLGTWVLLGFGCSPPDSPPAAPVAPLASVTTSAQTAEAAPPPAPDGQASCRLDTELWRGVEEGEPLRAPGGGVYVRVVHASARVVLSLGAEASTADVVASYGGAQLRGTMRLREVPLYPRRPLLFEGFALVRPSTRVQVTSGEGGQLRVSHHLQGGVVGDVLQAEVACDDVSLDPGSRHAGPTTARRGDARLARLRGTGEYPLSVTPTGPPVATIGLYHEPTSEWFSDQVIELAYRDGKSRIAWPRVREAVTGWVPAQALYIGENDEPDAEPDDEEAIERPEPWEPHGSRRCQEPVPLLAAEAGLAPERAIEVGTVGARTTITEVDPESAEDLREVELPGVLDGFGFVGADGVRFFMRATELSRCKVVDS